MEIGIAGKILKWSDKLFDRAVETENEAKGKSMAFASGIIKGVVDVCIIHTAIQLVSLLVKKKH